LGANTDTVANLDAGFAVLANFDGSANHFVADA
jgi:hypothetical protein